LFGGIGPVAAVWVGVAPDLATDRRRRTAKLLGDPRTVLFVASKSAIRIRSCLERYHALRGFDSVMFTGG